MRKIFLTLLLAVALSPLCAFATGVIDLNAADAATLEQVKGIGPSKAAAIVKYREQNGPFASVDDLVRVPGIGEKTLQQLREQFAVSAARKAEARTK